MAPPLTLPNDAGFGAAGAFFGASVLATLVAFFAPPGALALAGADAEANILKGWRRDAAGKDLLSLL